MNDYGQKGLIGVLTPQANTTVEPEFWTLLPTGWSLINTRLTSKKKTIESRLVDYTKNFQKTAEQFANAPVNICLLYTSPSPRDGLLSRMPSSA